LFEDIFSGRAGLPRQGLGNFGRQGGLSAIPVSRGCVFVGVTGASVVSRCPPTKNISPGFVRVPLQSLPHHRLWLQ